MSAEINIDKRTVKKFLKNEDEPVCEGFLIPEYQRPYAWGDDQITTLFDDIWDFAVDEGGFKNKNATYFLGSVVLYKNEDRKVLEIIDGQQRLTSLCLLLRACYAKLEKDKDIDDQAKFLCEQIEEALWQKSIEDGQKWAEMEQKYNALLKEKTISEFKAKYLGLGYNDAAATKIAEAQANGDSTAMFQAMAEHATAMRETIKGELLKGTPGPEGAGGGSGGSEKSKDVEIAEKIGKASADNNAAARNIVNKYIGG